MAGWKPSNLGQWYDVDGDLVGIDVEKSMPGTGSTIAGGLVILGRAHGVSLRVRECCLTHRPCVS